MARRTLRASDADREQFAERLRQAAAEGRIVSEELEDRLGDVFRARTYGELDAVVADLPRASVDTRRRRARPLVAVRSLPPVALVVLMPVALALAAAAIVVVATLFALWLIVFIFTLGAFARRPRRYYHHPVRYARSMHTSGRWRA